MMHILLLIKWIKYTNKITYGEMMFEDVLEVWNQRDPCCDGMFRIEFRSDDRREKKN